MHYYLDSLRRDWPALIMLGLLLAIPASALAVAGWTDGLRVLTLIVLLAMAVGYLLAISHFNDITTIVFATFYGVFAVWVMGAGFIESDILFREKMVQVAYRFTGWAYQAVTGGFSRDNLMFVILLGMGFWYLGFNAAVNVFRTSGFWIATVPPGIALLINQYYYFGAAPMQGFLVAYLFLTFTLAVRTNIVQREQIWRRARVGVSPGIQFDLLRGGVIAIILLITMAWSAPAASASNQLASAWDRSINPWNRVQDTFNRLFGGLDGGSSTSADYYGGSSLSLGGPVRLGDGIVMYVYAPQGYRYYWRSKLFDTYQGGRWLTADDARGETDFGVLPAETPDKYILRTTVQQQFEIVVPATRLVYSAPQPISFSSLPVTFDIIYTGSGKDYGSVTAVRGKNMLSAGRSYIATSSMTQADETSLRTAGEQYPAWVSTRYLQLPDTITQRTRDLAASIAAPYDNPYDKARAIEAYLRQNITYNQNIEAPPKDSDPVDYVLFESHEGYCNYYAGSMVVMLRSVGVPARIAAGFAQGVRDTNLNAYQVKESDAHTWVEVFFPTYGWVEFEPTSAIEPIVRPERTIDTSGALAGRLQELATERPNGAIPDIELTPQTEQEVINPILPLPRIVIPPAVWWLMGLGLVGVAMMVGSWVWLEQRGMYNLSEVSKSYARLNIFAPIAGIGLPDSATPYERASRLSSELPEGEGPIKAITGYYVQEQYAPPPETPMHIDRHNQEAKDAWASVRSMFLKAGVRKLADTLIGRINPFSKAGRK